MPPVAPRTKTVAYLRVSTDKQADEGVSLDVQREKVLAYAATYDLDVIDVVVDAGESAKTLDRPGMRRVLEMLRSKEADALLVMKLDRLTRSVVHLGQLVEEFFASDRVALLSVFDQIDTRTAAGRLVLNVLVSVSQWEREAIGERTSLAMQRMKADRKFLGGQPPYGFRVSGDAVEPEPSEQTIIEKVRSLRSSGSSLRDIVRELEADGVTSRRGTPFRLTQVARMVAVASPGGL